MRLLRMGVAAALAMVLVFSAGQDAAADSEYLTERLPFSVTPQGAAAGHPQLRAGHFVNIHAEGPVIYTQERFMVNGARPNTTYQLVLRFYDECGGTGIFDLPFVVIQTDPRGNGHTSNTFQPSDVSLRGTIHIAGVLVANGVQAYATPCFEAVLD